MAFSDNDPKNGADDLTSAGSVSKNILVEGGGEKAGRGAKVTIKYSMRLSSDRTSEPFDTSDNRKDGVLQFTLGRKKVIPALEILTQSMKLGEKCEATAEAPYAFGSRGLKRKGVPPNARIYMTVEMLACEGGEIVKTMAQMTPSERLEEAKRCKESGNNFFKELKYEKAMSQYGQCIRYLSNVFYKPSASLSDAAVTPLSKPLVVASETPSIQSNAASLRPEREEKDNAAGNGPDEEGFTEAKVIDGTATAMKESGADGTDEVPIIDVSTASRKDGDTASADNTTPGTSQAESSRIPRHETLPEKTSPSPADQRATGTDQNTAKAIPENDDPEEEDVVALHVTTLNNLALCLVKLEEYKRAAETASVALRMDPANHKALFYRGRAQIALGDWDKARSDLVAALEIQPKNMGIRMEIEKLDRKKKQFEEKEKKQAAAMFA